MRRITSRFVLLIASAAVAPLVLYGVISIVQPEDGNGIDRSERAIGGWPIRSRKKSASTWHTTPGCCSTVGLVLRGINMEPWQQSRVLKDYVIDFPEFREITFFGSGGRRHRHQPRRRGRLCDAGSGDRRRRPTSSSPHCSSTRTTFRARLSRFASRREARSPAGSSARLRSSRSGGRSIAFASAAEGYALLVAEEQRLIAHGNPNKKRLVAATVEAGTPRTPEQDFAASAARAARATRLTVPGNSPTPTTGRCSSPGAVVPRPSLGRHRRTADRRGVRAGAQARSVSSSSPSASPCSARSSWAGSGAAPSSRASSR